MHWKNELANSLKSKHELDLFFETSFPKIAYPIFITPYLAKKIKYLGLDSILAKEFLPTINENEPSGLIDPIGDRVHQKTNSLIHRYKNRVLFLPTNKCPVICRYCFRKNELAANQFAPDFKNTLSYLQEHQEIEEIIFSGGDPLFLSDKKLQGYLESFKQIKHIKYIRFHTRAPFVLPSRITNEFIDLCEWVKDNFISFNLVLHCNHAQEFDEEVFASLCKLKNINLLGQTVLLKGINDSASELAKLMSLLIEANIKPYYLHHPDKALGTSHFWVTLDEGKNIYQKLIKELPGWGTPNYILDHESGSGKVRINCE